jgi:hypothetical protein
VFNKNPDFRFALVLFFWFVGQFFAFGLFERLGDIGIPGFEALKTAVWKQIDRSLKLKILFVCNGFIVDRAAIGRAEVENPLIVARNQRVLNAMSFFYH